MTDLTLVIAGRDLEKGRVARGFVSPQHSVNILIDVSDLHTFLVNFERFGTQLRFSHSLYFMLLPVAREQVLDRNRHLTLKLTLLALEPLIAIQSPHGEHRCIV